tara:strand:+ start:44 stop:1204 length:1161 start_codon:yes stop_codon:yes gene_type:complete
MSEVFSQKNRLMQFEKKWSDLNDLNSIGKYDELKNEVKRKNAKLSRLRREQKTNKGFDAFASILIIGGLFSAFIAMFILLAYIFLFRWEQYNANPEEEFSLTLLFYIWLGLMFAVIIYYMRDNGKDKKNIDKLSLEIKLKEIELEEVLKSKEKLEDRKEKERLRFLKKEILDVTNELDKDGNNTLDLAESEDSFMGLLKSQQKKILEFEKTEGKGFTNKFVKLSNFLKQKRAHMQNLFSQFKQIKSLEVLDNAENLIKSDMYMYNLLLLDSLHMISSFVDDDRISFNIIYEKFDALNVWNTNFQNQMLNKLDLLNDNIDRLRGDISEMNHNSNMIIDKLQDLSHISEENNRVLDKQLEKINSSIKANTVLNAINTYQNYTTNKRLK